MIGGGESRVARVRCWLLGSVAVPGAVGLANRLGLGPVSPTSRPGRSGAPGSRRWPTWSMTSGSSAAHVIFGHTHRRGGPEPARGALLWNTGSWVHSPGLLGDSAAVSPYWPGTVCLLGDDGEPELRHVLDALEPAELDRDRPR